MLWISVADLITMMLLLPLFIIIIVNLVLIPSQQHCR